jgi:hypothetical protein
MKRIDPHHGLNGECQGAPSRHPMFRGSIPRLKHGWSKLTGRVSAQRLSERAAGESAMSVLENLPSLIDRPRSSRRAVATAPTRRSRHHHHRRSRRSPELQRRPDPEYHENEIGDGAAGDRTIESFGQQPLHRRGGPSRSSRSVGIAPPSLARARVITEIMVNAETAAQR